MNVHQVARKHYQIDPLLVNDTHQLLDKGRIVPECSQMKVAELQDLVTIERLWKQLRHARLATYHNPTPAEEKSIDESYLYGNGQNDGQLPRDKELKEDENEFGQPKT